MELLRELCEATAIPGREERLREIVRRELTLLVDEIQVDPLGNMIGIRRGASGKRLALNAHMDEIGFFVRHVDDDGFLRLQPIGGHDPRNMVAQRVRVCGKRDLTGLLYPGLKPPHLQEAADREKPPKLSDFFVDLGLPGPEVKELVPIGSMAVIHRELTEVGNTVTCKAMDNRLSVYVMIEALRRTHQAGFEVYAVATVQEEVGVRGAVPAAYAVNPDVGIALDITIAADLPGVERSDWVTHLGDGTAIKIMDSDSISDARVVQALRELAAARGIPHQMEILPCGGTDAAGLQMTRAGVPVCTISTPTRYVHTSIEMCHKTDIEASIALTAAFIEQGHEYDFRPV